MQKYALSTGEWVSRSQGHWHLAIHHWHHGDIFATRSVLLGLWTRLRWFLGGVWIHDELTCGQSYSQMQPPTNNRIIVFLYLFSGGQKILKTRFLWEADIFQLCKLFSLPKATRVPEREDEITGIWRIEEIFFIRTKLKSCLTYLSCG